MQYVDFAYWQRHTLPSQLLADQMAYWRTQLANIPTQLNLPTDHPRPARQTFNGDYRSCTFPEPLRTGLKRLCHQTGTTLYMTLLAAFNVLLYRYTGETDILVGTPIANRHRAEVEDLIGFFVNTLVMRTDLRGHPTFAQVLTRVRQTALTAYAHQDLPFEQLVEALQPQRHLNHSPLFQVMFILLHDVQSSALPPGLSSESVDVPVHFAKFDLTLAVLDRADEMVVSLEYNTDLFDGETIERMIDHLQTLLTAVLANVDQPIATLPLLTAREQTQFLYTWNETAVSTPHRHCIHELFMQQAARTPQATAIAWEHGTWTYQQLALRVQQLARFLQAAGVGPGVLVGIVAERAPEMILGLLGVLQAGGAYVPLDPAYPQERLAFMLTDTAAPILLTQEHLLSQLPVTNGRILCLDRDWQMIASQSTALAEKEGALSVSVTPDDLAYVIYTSGSTGQAKGVLLRHRGLSNLVAAQIQGFGLNANSRVLQFASFSFDAAVSEIFTTLLAGGTLYMAHQEQLASIPELHRLLQQVQITAVTLPPSMLALLPIAGLEKLHTVISAGEACPPDVARRWAKNRRFINAYGPTEATIGPTMVEIQADMVDDHRPLPIGRPIANMIVYVLDPNQQLVPVGIPGELYIGGPGVAQGYLNRPTLTAEKFVPNPFLHDETEVPAVLYRTGDRVRYRPDGMLEFLGRIDHQVKLRGFRIEPGEIESALTHHPQVTKAYVLVREDQPGDKRLVAYVMTSVAADDAADQFRTFLRERLPNYMIPSIFIPLTALPLTPNGKVDGHALPTPIQLAQTRASVLPRTPLETVLTLLWQEVLGEKQIGVEDNFFDLGGHSILAAQLMSRIHEMLHVKLSLRCLFEASTVAELAQVLLAESSPARIERQAQRLLILAQMSDKEVAARLR